MKVITVEQLAHIETIKTIIYNLARGLDRVDDPLLRECFWDDATDDHGLFKGSASDFVDWVTPLLKTMKRTQHYIANVIVDLDGNTAKAESYFLAYHEIIDGQESTDMLAAGRYLDTFECRDNEWKMTHRQAVYDWNRNDKSTHNWYEEPFKDLLLRGTRYPDDPSYK
jgi:hypothetical protein